MESLSSGSWATLHASGCLLTQGWGWGWHRQGHFVSFACFAEETSWELQDAEEGGALPHTPPPRAGSAAISLVSGGWPLPVVAHYTRVVSPLSPGK